MKKTLLILIVIFGVIGAYLVGAYNNLIILEEKTESAWAQVENVYKRRFDLIPNLVSTVQGVADFESSTFQAVTEARSAWAKASESSNRGDQINAIGSLDSALSRLLVTVESYPQLKAQANFTQLQNQLEGTENRISTERRAYNEVVQSFNTTIKRIPNNILAGLFGFDAKDYFEISEQESQNPQVEFDFKPQE